MIILRYFMLVQLYHWATFYKQTPWSFIIGVLLFPYHLVSRMLYPSECRVEIVLNGIECLKSYWELPEATLPPEFIKKRFLYLESELKNHGDRT